MSILTKLTKKQEEKLAHYLEEGLKIGRATGGEIDIDFVHELINSHRQLCNIPPAKEVVLYDSPRAAIRAEQGLTPSNALYGQHDISWLQTYQFFRTECGWKEETKWIVYLYELAKITGWIWLTPTKNIVTRRPETISLVQRGWETFTDTDGKDVQIPNMVLHNENGPSLSYRDGFSLYCLDGMLLDAKDEWIVTTPADKLKAEDILKINNTEIRSAAMRKIGIEHMLDKLDNKVLNKKKSKTGGNYVLYEVRFPDGLVTKQLGMTCPSSGKFHLEEVHTDCEIVNQALNWRERESLSKIYKEPRSRT